MQNLPGMSKMSPGATVVDKKGPKDVQDRAGTECSFWCSIVKSLLLSRTLSFKQWGWVT